MYVYWEWFAELSWLIECLNVDCDAIIFSWIANLLYLLLLHVGDPLQLYLFILLIKMSTLAESFISKIIMIHTFEIKYFNEFKINFVVLTVFLKKSVWDLILWFKSLTENVSLIMALEIFSLTLNSSMAQNWMFLLWIQTDLSFWRSYCDLYRQYIMIFHVCDLSFYLVLCHETQRLMDSSQTGLQQMTSLTFFFVENS